MTERLDRIEEILQNTAQKQAKNAEEIEALVGAVSTNETAIRELTANVARTTANVDRVTAKAEGNEMLFETVRVEAREDRAETRRLWNDAVTQMNTDREAFREKSDSTIAQINTDRAEYRERFDAAMQKADERHAAQMEVIQTLLLELTKSNGNINSLRDRVDRLEAS